MDIQLENETDVLEDVSGKLISAGIPFMVTGSMAMNYYAQPRMTRDIDIVISLKSRDVENLFLLFEKDYYISKEAIYDSLERGSMFNIIHDRSVIKVDFILLKDQEYRHIEFQRRKKITIRHFKTYIVNKEDLILSKLVWAEDTHSELQIRDVKNLIRTGCDEEYLKEWVEKLDLKAIYKEIRNG